MNIQEKRKIEKELKDEFLQRFYDTVGYFPIVITRSAQEEGKAISLADLEKCILKHLKVKKINNENLKLSSSSRIRPLSELRFIFFYLAKRFGYTLQTIGNYAGGRDHTTVIHGIQTFNNLYQVDEDFRNKANTIISEINYYIPNESSTMEDTNQVEAES